MDVSVSNLPQDISDKAFRTQLAPKLSALGIQDWSCNKQRKKKNGTITFLHARDGESFLRDYGALDMPGQIGRNGMTKQEARLYLWGDRVFCHRGRQEPDPFHLKALQKASNDRLKKVELDRQKKDNHDDQPKTMNVAFALPDMPKIGLSCGYYTYDEATSELVYASQVDWHTPDGNAKFSKYKLTVTYIGAQGALIRVEIPYRIIESVITSSTPEALTLTLWEVPRIFADRDGPSSFLAAMARLSVQKGPQGPTRDRLTKIPHGSADHGQVIGQCLVYRIYAPAAGFHERIEVLKRSDLFSIGHQNTLLTMPTRVKQDIAIGIKKFNALISECSKFMPFDVLYQLQTLVQNAYLLPWTVEVILRRLAEHYRGGSNASQTKTKVTIHHEPILTLHC